MPVSPELEFVRRETERTTRAASAEALSRASNGKWSPVQILEHLALSYTATTKGLLRATQSGQIERGDRTLKHRAKCVYVLGLGTIPFWRGSAEACRSRRRTRRRPVAPLQRRVSGHGFDAGGR